MSRSVAVRLPSEPGWIAMCHAIKDGEVKITLHDINGWGMTPDHPGMVPMTIGGEIISNRPNFLGIIGPNDDKSKSIRNAFELLKLTQPHVKKTVDSGSLELEAVLST